MQRERKFSLERLGPWGKDEDSIHEKDLEKTSSVQVRPLSPFQFEEQRYKISHQE